MYNFRTQVDDSGSYRDYIPQEPLLLSIYDECISAGIDQVTACHFCLIAQRAIIRNELCGPFN